MASRSARAMDAPMRGVRSVSSSTNGRRWLARTPVAAGPVGDRPAATETVRLATGGLAALQDLDGWNDETTSAWHARARALEEYRRHLPGDGDTDDIVGSVLHMHHNRMVGIDPDFELRCRRLARQAALHWLARHGSDDS